MASHNGVAGGIVMNAIAVPKTYLYKGDADPSFKLSLIVGITPAKPSF